MTRKLTNNEYAQPVVPVDGDGNAPPSNPAGLASKATLVAAGWVCTTN